MRNQKSLADGASEAIAPAESPSSSLHGISPFQTWEKIYLVIVVIFILFIWYHGFSYFRLFFHDDSFISLRYARNWINGQGLVWNPSEKVEGYTNFLFVILVGLLGKLKIDLIVASRIVGILAFALIQLAMAVVVIRSLRRPDRDILRSTLPLLFTFGSFPLMIWSLGGLETSLFTFLLCVAVMTAAQIEKNSPWLAAISGAVFAFASMTRPEGLALFFIAILYTLWRMSRRENAGELGQKRAVWLVLAFIMVYLPYFIWRYTYYGDLFPNTFYAKTGFDALKMKNGFIYLLSFALSPPYIGPVLILACVFAWTRKHWQPRMTYLFLNIAAIVAMTVYVGGDHMPAFRFFIPGLPLMSLLLYEATFPLFRGLARSGRTLAVLAVVVLLVIPILNPPYPLERARIVDPAAFIGTIVGKYIAANWPPGSLIALNTAGSTPYYCPENRFIDMLGLVDRHIAKRPVKHIRMGAQTLPGHVKGDGIYVLSRRPDYIIIGPADGRSDVAPWFLSDLEIVESPDFPRLYQRRIVAISTAHIPYRQCYDSTWSGTMRFAYYERMK